MVNKCYIALTRQVTDNLTLSFTNNYDESCQYNADHTFCLTFLGAEGQINSVVLSYEQLGELSDNLRNLQDISNTLPHKDSMGY